MTKVMIRGAELYFEVEGQGPPLLLLHGGMGHDHHAFRPWLDPLTATHTVIFLDQRGNGRSTGALETLSMASWVADVEALREHLGYARWIVLGHSYGSFVAQEYALAHPDRVLGLALVASTTAFDYPERMLENARARATKEQMDALLAALGGPLPSDEAWKRCWETIVPMYFHDWPKVAQRVLDPAMIYRAPAMNAAMHGADMAAWNTASRLPALNVPTLIASGADDWICPLDLGAKRLHEALPDARLVVFERSGHFPFIEENAAFLEHLLDWSEGLDGGVRRVARLEEERRNEETYRRLVREAWNGRRPELLFEVLHPACARLDNSDPTVRGGGDVVALARELVAAVPDLEYVVEHIVTKRDTLAVTFHIRGRATGTLRGFEGRGRPIHVAGASFSRWKSGKIIENRVVWDEGALRRQLT